MPHTLTIGDVTIQEGEDFCGEKVSLVERPAGGFARLSYPDETETKIVRETMCGKLVFEFVPFMVTEEGKRIRISAYQLQNIRKNSPCGPPQQ